MKMSNKLISLIILFAYHSLSGQNCINYSLDQLLQIGEKSYVTEIQKSNALINKYNNRLFHIRVYPKVKLSATLPNLVNSISPITLNDGSEKFINRFYMSSSMSMSVSQFLPFTGGTLSINSGLTRLDNFTPKRTKSFNLNMFNLSYSQSISSFNSYKWDKEIMAKENDLFEVSNIQYQESVNLKVVELFFELYSIQKEIELNRMMIERAEKVVEQMQVLYENGKTSEINVQNAIIDLANLKNTIAFIQEARLQAQLCGLLNLDHKIVASFDVESIESIKLNYDIDLVISRALHYSNGIKRDIEILQEQRDLKELRVARYPTISLSVGGGVNSQAEEIKKLTGLKSNSLSALVSISVPILSWKESRIKTDIAEESARIRSIEYRQTYNELENAYRYDLKNLELILSSIINDKSTLELLYMKYEQVLANYEQGRVNYIDLADTRNQIMKLEIKRINKIKLFYVTIYSFRRYALYDIIHNECLI